MIPITKFIPLKGGENNNTILNGITPMPTSIVISKSLFTPPGSNFIASIRKVSMMPFQHTSKVIINTGKNNCKRVKSRMATIAASMPMHNARNTTIK